jgi:hypothetical protein
MSFKAAMIAGHALSPSTTTFVVSRISGTMAGGSAAPCARTRW